MSFRIFKKIVFLVSLTLVSEMAWSQSASGFHLTQSAFEKSKIAGNLAPPTKVKKAGSVNKINIAKSATELKGNIIHSSPRVYSNGRRIVRESEPSNRDGTKIRANVVAKNGSKSQKKVGPSGNSADRHRVEIKRTVYTQVTSKAEVEAIK